MTALFHAHSGLRYLVLLAAVLLVGYAGYGLATKRPFDKAGRILGAAFVGLLDLQVLLGLVLVATGVFYPALVGHIACMLGAVAASHVTLAKNRRAAKPGWVLPLAGVAGALVLIVLGILAIGRGPLAMAR